MGLLAAAMCVSLISSNASAQTVNPTTSAGQLIGAVVGGTSYTVTVTGNVYLCSTCNNGGPLVFNPDGKTTGAQGSYAAFNSTPLDHDPSVGPMAYGPYGAGINFGELYGSFFSHPDASQIFAIGYGTTFTPTASGYLYGVINDSAYGDNPNAPVYTVALVPTVASVPEPAAWGMMIFGMGAIGIAMRRRVRRSNEKFDARIKAIAAGEIL